MKDKYLARGL